MHKISIVVPCYNMEEKVQKCIDSIKKQTYKNFEVLMIDDGSKDKTKEVIRANIKDDKRFKYYYKTNGGLSSARNYGIEKSSGQYICFVDSDDYIESDYLELLYNSLIENDSDISMCYFTRIYERKNSVNKIEYGFNNLIKYPTACNKLYKMELFKKNNIRFPIGKWYEDLGTFPKLFMLSKKISIVEKSLYNYIQNSSSIMHTYDDRIYQIYDIIDEVEDFAKNKKLYKKYKDNIEFMSIYHVLIGTIYRSSFTENFSTATIENIVNRIEKKYPDWANNCGIKDLSIPFRVYLVFLAKKKYKTLYILLKSFNRKVNL